MTNRYERIREARKALESLRERYARAGAVTGTGGKGMSDEMMLDIAKMPYELAMHDELSRHQFYMNTQRLVAALEAAREDACVLRRDNERLAEALRNIAAMRWWYGEDLMDAAGAARDALAQEYRND